MQANKTWDEEAKHTITKTKSSMADMSIKVRSDQFKIFKKLSKFKKTDKILDVGVTSDETLKDSNIFERLYPYQNKLVAATIENAVKFKKLYPGISKVVKITPHKKLPFKDKEFDIVVSWATIEHVGGYGDQQFFLNELGRVGKMVFLTTPYRGCVYEPHTGLPLVQWLPLSLFRSICKLTGRNFWATEKHLNPLYVKNVKTMKLDRIFKVQIYKMFKFLPSHLLIYSK